tara:strand:- start:689 stop:1897 length:1209 start_codon:yes stop_codon:yes gene_type:complete
MTDQNNQPPSADDKLDTWMYDLPEDVEKQQVDIVKYDVTSSPNDFNVSTLINFIERGSIIIPRYQRNYVWDRRRASKLIESLILGLPIPQLFLYQEEKNKYSILDGQQRLLTIYFFYKMRFPRAGKRAFLRENYGEFNNFAKDVLANNDYFSEFSLFFGRDVEGQNNPLQNEKYDTLGENQMSLDLRTVRCVIIKQNEPDEADSSSVFEIFDRLNTGGVNLKPQQIRSNIYHSSFYDQIHELNKNETWRGMLGKPNLDDNSRDEELMLRMLGMMFYGPEDYTPSMTQFLNRFSQYMKKLDKLGRDREIELVSSIFSEFLNLITPDHFEHFLSDGRFSIGTAESVFYASTLPAWNEKNTDKLIPFSPKQVSEVSTQIRQYLLEGSAQKDNVKGRLIDAANIIK